MLAACCLAASCSTKTDSSMPETRNITNEDFKEHQLEYEVLPVEITDYIRSIKVYDDIAYFSNDAGDELVSIYDLKNSRRIGSVIKKGHGPNELLGQGWRVQMSEEKGLASIFDVNNNVFMAFPLEVLTRAAAGDADNVFTPFAKFTGESRNIDMAALGTDVFVGVCAERNATMRLRFYDGDGNITSEKGGFYRTPGMRFPEEINWHAFDGRLASREDGKRMVVANVYTDQIEIYDGQGDLIRLVKGPDHFDPDVGELTQGNFTQYVLGMDARVAYSCPVAKKKGFWSTYHGYATMIERENSKEPKFSVILSFDWEGKPLGKYIIQANITYFDVDESRGLIYGIMMTEEGEQKIIKAKYK